jgi:hypothetical protein
VELLAAGQQQQEVVS